MAQVVALVDDLFFQAKLIETAKQLGVELRTCATADALADEIGARAAEADCGGFECAVESARGDRARARQRAGNSSDWFSFPRAGRSGGSARAAGCEDVMPRSKFTQNLATILARAKSES